MRDSFVKALDAYEHAEMPLTGKNAAVLVPIRGGTEPCIVFTVRQVGMRTHAGEVAYPGGKQDSEDMTLWDTAIREAWEEIELKPTAVKCLGRLDTRESLHGLYVSPFVGLIESETPLGKGDDEVSKLFTVPLAHFLDLDKTLYSKPRAYGEKTFHVPHFEYEGIEIFGLTAVITINLVDALLGTQTEPFLDRTRAAT